VSNKQFSGKKVKNQFVKKYTTTDHGSTAIGAWRVLECGGSKMNPAPVRLEEKPGFKLNETTSS